MLSSLSIKNYALIEDVHIDLKKSLNIITGETGAGKSIILGALGLIIGNRADLSSLKDNQKKCIIEANFNIAHLHLKPLFEKLDLDYETNTIIRREILASGKSRAFVNDSPVKLQSLQLLGNELIDIHSQQETRSLAESAYQYQIVDSIAGVEVDLKAFKKQDQKIKKLSSQLNQLIEKEAELIRARDYKAFLLSELEEAKLSEIQLEELESEQLQLSNVEAIKEQLSFASNAIQEENYGISEQLNEINNRFQKISDFGEQYSTLQERFNSLRIEAEDLSFEVDKLNTSLEDDPQSLEKINDRLALIYKLQKKHQVESLEELLQIEENLAQEVFETENIQNQISSLEKEISAEQIKLVAFGKTLHKKRKAVLPKLIEKAKVHLQDLAMPNVQFDFHIHFTEKASAFGMDEMEWKFSANKGSSPKPIGKIASGGELSRLTLALKFILAEHKKLPTIIFDEIDTGVSGDVALKIGNMLSAMGNFLQVVSITHLPQIASKGEQHFKVYKQELNARTTTQLKALNKEERITEIAEMLGGDATSTSAIAHAKTLFQ
ncbi:DNA repair protein RecN [Psychroflexus planctonicus]|uniref:DNA repair protein RecN n=1 Tax=Psychroflexus planctonicus TaxID=1526575 RepID=A0ABQ1SGU9_9FLAO|nr:DNA repair protein RecN [Psychroflexus planctonicus]GGE30558.1 DNA repair protein RecN [Psychroflexus planctonicus]